MKKYILFGLFAAILVVQQAYGQLAQQFTNAHTLFLTILDCADPKDESMKLSLAGRWDLLSEGLPGSMQAVYKEKGARAFRTKYGVFPYEVDLTKLSQLGNLKRVCAARQARHDFQKREMNSTIATVKSAITPLETSVARTQVQLKDLKGALVRLSKSLRILNDVASDIRLKLAPFETAKLQPGQPAPAIAPELQEELANDAEALQTAFSGYQKAVRTIQEKGKQLGIDLDLSDELVEQAMGSMVTRANEAAQPTVGQPTVAPTTGTEELPAGPDIL